jgi:hypothetical protein
MPSPTFGLSSPTTALAAIASKRGARADMDKQAIDIAKALARLSDDLLCSAGLKCL